MTDQKEIPVETITSQDAIEIFINPDGSLCIRQEDSNGDSESILVNRDYILLFLGKINKIVGGA